jgi:hypothetical protein
MEKCLVIYTVLNNIFRGYHMLCNRFTGEVVSHFVCLSYTVLWFGKYSSNFAGYSNFAMSLRFSLSMESM